MARSKRDQQREQRKVARREEYQARARQRRQKRMALFLAALLGLSGLGTATIFLMNQGGGSDNDAAGSTDNSLAENQNPANDGGQDTNSENPCPIPQNVVTEPAVQLEEAPNPEKAENRDWEGTITTSCGDIEITLDGEAAPQGVSSFLELADAGFYDHTACHRLTTTGIFVLQCGDPTGVGNGGPGYEYGPIENAPSDDIYPAGTLAMARLGDDPNSMGSQFFITYEDSTIPADQAGGYTVLGQVTSGLEVVSRIAAGGLAADGVAPQWPIAIEKVALQ